MSTWPTTHTLGRNGDVLISVIQGTNGRYTWALWLEGVSEDRFYAQCDAGDGDGVDFATADEAVDDCCTMLDILTGRLDHWPARKSLWPARKSLRAVAG